MCDRCAALLSEGLDLCVRARAMDARDRTNAQLAMSTAGPDWWAENLARRAEMHNEAFPDTPMSTRSGTLPLWVQDQYDRDLADWERRARALLTAHEDPA